MRASMASLAIDKGKAEKTAASGKGLGGKAPVRMVARGKEDLSSFGEVLDDEAAAANFDPDEDFVRPSFSLARALSSLSSAVSLTLFPPADVDARFELCRARRCYRCPFPRSTASESARSLCASAASLSSPPRLFVCTCAARRRKGATGSLELRRTARRGRKEVGARPRTLRRPRLGPRRRLGSAPARTAPAALARGPAAHPTCAHDAARRPASRRAVARPPLAPASRHGPIALLDSPVAPTRPRGPPHLVGVGHGGDQGRAARALPRRERRDPHQAALAQPAQQGHVGLLRRHERRRRQRGPRRRRSGRARRAVERERRHGRLCVVLSPSPLAPSSPLARC